MRHSSRMHLRALRSILETNIEHVFRLLFIRFGTVCASAVLNNDLVEYYNIDSFSFHKNTLRTQNQYTYIGGICVLCRDWTVEYQKSYASMSHTQFTSCVCCFAAVAAAAAAVASTSLQFSIFKRIHVYLKCGVSLLSSCFLFVALCSNLCSSAASAEGGDPRRKIHKRTPRFIRFRIFISFKKIYIYSKMFIENE